MTEQMFINVLEISVSMIPVLVLLFLFSRRISRFYSAKWNYFVWMLLAVRLMVPFHFTLPTAPVAIQMPAQISQPIAVSHTVSAASSQAAAPAVSAVTPAVPAAHVSSGLSIMQIFFLIWICGIVLFICFHFTGHLLFLHRVKNSRCAVTNPEIIKLFRQKQEELKIQNNIELYRCSGIGSPMLIGFFRPAILLPDCMVTREELGIILSHELIHFKRHDLWYQLLLITANAVHWFNPFVYFMVRQADNDLELFCDEEVVKNQSKSFRQTYGEAILVFLRQGVHNTTTFSTDFLGGSKPMKQRFIRLYDNKKKKHGIASMAAVLCATVLTGAFVACTAKPASQPVNAESKPASSVSQPISSSAESVSSASSPAKSDSANSAQSSSKQSDQVSVSSAPEAQQIAQKTKDYLLNGQNDKIEAQQLHWSETFLNQVDIEAVYKQYLAAGGKADDIKSFAKYLTDNAPVPSNWKEMFESDLMRTYHVKVSRYEHVQGTLYQAYAKINGSEVPYVGVVSRTGWFHG